MLTLVFVCATSLWQLQSAPPDVPKDHWAFPTVDALFKEGLLKGYPSGKQPPLKLDKSIKQDLKQAAKVLAGWKAEGLLVGYPDNHGHRRPASNYEIAVGVYAVWSNTKELMKDQKSPVDLRKWAHGQLPAMSKIVSVFEPELTKLGANPIQMIAALNDLNDSPLRQFHGERR